MTDMVLNALNSALLKRASNHVDTYLLDGLTILFNAGDAMQPTLTPTYTGNLTAKALPRCFYLHQKLNDGDYKLRGIYAKD